MDAVSRSSLGGSTFPELHLTESNLSLFYDNGVCWYELAPGSDLKSVNLEAGFDKARYLVISNKSSFWNIKDLVIVSSIPVIFIAPRRIHLLGLKSTCDLYLLTGKQVGDTFFEVEFGSCILIGDECSSLGSLIALSNEIYLEKDISAEVLKIMAVFSTSLELTVNCFEEHILKIFDTLSSMPPIVDKVASGTSGAVVSLAPDLRLRVKKFEVAASDPVNGGRIAHRHNLLNPPCEVLVVTEFDSMKLECECVNLYCDGSIEKFKFLPF